MTQGPVNLELLKETFEKAGFPVKTLDRTSEYSTRVELNVPHEQGRRFIIAAMNESNGVVTILTAKPIYDAVGLPHNPERIRCDVTHQTVDELRAFFANTMRRFNELSTIAAKNGLTEGNYHVKSKVIRPLAAA